MSNNSFCTGSYSSYRENLVIPNNCAPSFLNSDDSSSEPETTIQPKKSSRLRKTTNKDLIDTDSSTSTYDNNYTKNNPKYHYNSDSSFILSTNSSSLSIQKQQYKINNTIPTKLEQTPTLYNKKERIGHATLQPNFKQSVDKYIAKRESIINPVQKKELQLR